METFGSATGIYDQALTETILSSLDFDYEEGVKWYCIQSVFSHPWRRLLPEDRFWNRGGFGVIADAMKAKLPAKNIVNGARATAIAPTDSGLNIKIAREHKPWAYSHVISTIPFSCFRMVDTSQ